MRVLFDGECKEYVKMGWWRIGGRPSTSPSVMTFISKLWKVIVVTIILLLCSHNGNDVICMQRDLCMCLRKKCSNRCSQSIDKKTWWPPNNNNKYNIPNHIYIKFIKLKFTMFTIFCFDILWFSCMLFWTHYNWIVVLNVILNMLFWNNMEIILLS